MVAVTKIPKVGVSKNRIVVVTVSWGGDRHALVFGSVAAGKAKPGSDIDLLVVGSASFASVVDACHAGSRRLGREVNPVVMTRAALEQKASKGDRFINRISKEPKIFLTGDASEFGRLAEGRAA